jgi:serine/threonine-protein kinase
MQVPEWLVSLIYKCLQKNFEDRFANGIELHNYISHHRIYTAEVAGLVKNEDEKWQSIVAKKDAELEELKALVARQKKQFELPPQRIVEPTVAVVSDNGQNKVSRSAFNSLLIVLFLVGAVAVYSLFFNKSVVGGTRTETANTAVDSLQNKTGATGSQVSENIASAKSAGPIKASAKGKKQVADSIANAVQARTAKPRPVNVKEDSTVEEVTAKQTIKEADDDNGRKADDGNSYKGDKDKARYKVRNVAYFHNEPDASTRRSAFINHWNNAILKPLDEKNGFIYIVYTNDEGQTSKGWLSKNDLIKLK